MIIRHRVYYFGNNVYDTSTCGQNWSQKKQCFILFGIEDNMYSHTLHQMRE